VNVKATHQNYGAKVIIENLKSTAEE
jgi:hypothetical protein